MLLHLAHLVLSSETLLWSNIHTFHYLNIPPGKLEHRIDSLSSLDYVVYECEASSSQPTIILDVIVVYPCFQNYSYKNQSTVVVVSCCCVMPCSYALTFGHPIKALFVNELAVVLFHGATDYMICHLMRLSHALLLALIIQYWPCSFADVLFHALLLIPASAISCFMLCLAAYRCSVVVWFHLNDEVFYALFTLLLFQHAAMLLLYALLLTRALLHIHIIHAHSFPFKLLYSMDKDIINIICRNIMCACLPAWVATHTWWGWGWWWHIVPCIFW